MDNRLIATVPVLRKVVPAFQESARTADARDARFEGLGELERAQLVAGLANALGALEECEKVAGVMSTPSNKIATLLQSLVVSNATDAAPLPNRQTLEAKFDTHDWLGWLGTFWEMVKHAAKFPWKDAPAGTERVAQFDKPAPRIAVFGDWGTGLYGAPLIRDSIAADSGIDIVLHLGDVYYSGKQDEIASRFTDMWPKRPGALNRSLNGNHEMYCGGQPYVDAIAGPPFNQACSHFAYENDNWTIVGLDSAYEDHDLAPSQASWLADLVGRARGRRIVLFSHHQPFSLLSGQGPKLVDKLRPLLEGGKIFAWYWGHEHECVLYDKHPSWNMYGRCIGHAGMPEFRPAAMGPAVATRQFRRFPGQNGVPASSILDGPNPYIKGEETKFTPHGYATLRFEPDRLVETIHDADGTALVTNELK
jgi:Calcineurin-like phosphoesterase